MKRCDGRTILQGVVAAPPSEAEILVAELETRLDRLRALYEQYFLGFEKLEPLIPRKDVDRRFDAIRRLHFRNTALRFKFNMLQQRYNTFQMYWLRICRQIEDGTYQRHLNKAKKRAELEKSKVTNVDDGWDVEIDTSETAEDLFASFESAKTKPPSAPPVFTLPPPHLTSLGVDDPFAASMPPPAKPKSDSPGSSPAPKSGGIVPGAFRPSIPPRIAPGSLVQGAEKKPVVLRKAEPAGPRTSAPATPAPLASKTIAAPPFVPPTIMAPPPTMTYAPAPLVNSKAPPTLTKAPPKAPPSAPKAGPATGKAPPKAPPKPPPSAPKGTPASSKAAPRLPLPSTAAKAPPLVRQKPPEGPRAPDVAPKREDDRKMRDLYSEYIEQKKSRNEATAHLSYDNVSKSLKDSGSKLAAKHEGKRVDFEVAVKDGATVLRPVIK